MSDPVQDAILDPSRLRALRETGLLDTAPELNFDRLTRLAGRLVGTPVALVSLVDANRQFFKSCVGLPDPWASCRQTPLSHSFCKHVVASRAPLQVDDAREAPLVAHNGAVADLGVIAYLGVPLILSDGQCLGAFCVIDGTPRAWSAEDLENLIDLAASVITEIELRQDICRRNAAEQRLRLLSSAVEEANDAFLISEGTPILHPGPRVVYVNKAFTRNTGYSFEEIVGKTPRVLQGPRTDPVTVARIREKLVSWEPVRAELINYRKDGSEFWVELNIRPVADAQGRYTHWVSVQRDITERKHAEEQLRQSAAENRKLAMVASRTTNAVMITDARGRIEWVNPGFTLLTEYSAEEALGQSPLDLLAGPDTDAATLAHLRERLADGLDAEVEILLHARSGKPFWVTRSIQPVHDDRGLLANFVSVDTNITARKELEGHLVAAKRAAEEANHAKSLFLANMSHEIRTPLNGIIGMTLLTLETPLNAQQREFLNTVRTSADALTAVIGDILDFSKIEAGKLDLVRVPFELRNLVEEVQRTFALRAHTKGLELVHRIAAGVPEHVIGDPHRLRQVLINLVGNAVKFTDRGEIVVEVESREAPGPNGGGGPEFELLVSVKDTGVGVTPEKRSRIFDPFVQADGDITRRHGGSGLGLAISNRLAEMMGGSIDVGPNADDGRGTIFRFHVRLVARRGAKVDLWLRPIAELEGRPVLIVDDNASLRRSLSEWIGQWGGRPIEAASAAEALAFLRASRSRPVAALVDGRLPDVDGVSLSGKLPDDALGIELPRIVLTTSDETRDSATSRELGIAGYLTKPVRQVELFESLVRLLRPGSDAAGSGLAPGEAGFILVPDDEAEDSTDTIDAIPQVEPAGPEPTRLRILLAEDHEVNQRVAAHMLRRQGHEVTIVSNGREAVEAIARHAHDLGLIDVQMPEMSGFEVVKHVREADAAGGVGRHFPMLALTAHAMKGDRERCLEAGFDGYIAKPIRPDELKAAILDLRL